MHAHACVQMCGGGRRCAHQQHRGGACLKQHVIQRRLHASTRAGVAP